MCNINLILRKDKTHDPKITEAMNTMSFNSFSSNSHGEGYVALNGKLRYHKSLKKIKYEGSYWFLATHQRFATSGIKDKSNSHPFVTKNLILMHNGIFSGMGNDKESDTAVYSRMLSNSLRKEKNIIKAIQETNKKVSGSYSVLVFSDNKVYYYKNASTRMFITQNKDYLIMSTVEENVLYAQWYLGVDGKTNEVDSAMIYDVLDNMKSLAEFEEKPVTYSQSYFNGFKEYGKKKKSYDPYDDYFYKDYWAEAFGKEMKEPLNLEMRDYEDAQKILNGGYGY